MILYNNTPNVLKPINLAKYDIIGSTLMCFEWFPDLRATSINVESPIYAHFPVSHSYFISRQCIDA